MRTVIEQNGYIRQRAAGGIVILRLADSRAEAIDAWYAECNKFMSHWEPGQRLRYLHDIRGAETVTPYATDRVVRVLRRMRNTPITDGRGAILLNSAALASILSSFFRRRRPGSWQIRFFRDESEAMRWLSE